ncbi:hypothetical protein HJFPF1_03310 [Paramyrothecium foliicola]|nr:hypothetical protein HJFPF1_03310 [Paramyrothecium foliicola]
MLQASTFVTEWAPLDHDDPLVTKPQRRKLPEVAATLRATSAKWHAESGDQALLNARSLDRIILKDACITHWVPVRGLMGTDRVVHVETALRTWSSLLRPLQMALISKWPDRRRWTVRNQFAVGNTDGQFWVLVLHAGGWCDRPTSSASPIPAAEINSILVGGFLRSPFPESSFESLAARALANSCKSDPEDHQSIAINGVYI